MFGQRSKTYHTVLNTIAEESEHFDIADEQRAATVIAQQLEASTQNNFNQHKRLISYTQQLTKYACKKFTAQLLKLQPLSPDQKLPTEGRHNLLQTLIHHTHFKSKEKMWAICKLLHEYGYLPHCKMLFTSVYLMKDMKLLYSLYYHLLKDCHDVNLDLDTENSIWRGLMQTRLGWRVIEFIDSIADFFSHHADRKVQLLALCANSNRYGKLYHAYADAIKNNKTIKNETLCWTAILMKGIYDGNDLFRILREAKCPDNTILAFFKTWIDFMVNNQRDTQLVNLQHSALVLADYASFPESRSDRLPKVILRMLLDTASDDQKNILFRELCKEPIDLALKLQFFAHWVQAAATISDAIKIYKDVSVYFPARNISLIKSIVKDRILEIEFATVKNDNHWTLGIDSATQNCNVNETQRKHQRDLDSLFRPSVFQFFRSAETLCYYSDVYKKIKQQDNATIDNANELYAAYLLRQNTKEESISQALSKVDDHDANFTFKGFK
jgi:hypothetical protein